MASEITEDEDQNPPSTHQKEAEKIRIRQIIDYQKSLYFSSSSSASSTSFSSSSSRSSSLLDLMREGSAPLSRLFEMEHTSLQQYFKDYSASPLIRPILLWGSDSDDHEVHYDPWAGFKRIQSGFGSRFGEHEWKLSSRESCSNIEEIDQQGKKLNKSQRRRLYRTISYKKLPRIGFWRCGRLRFKLRLIKKLRVLIRGRVF